MTRAAAGAGAVLLALAAVLAALAALVVSTGGATLHDAPVAVVAPDVVAVPLAEDVASATGGGLRMLGEPDRARAEALLADGDVLAVLVLDLRGTDDELLVAPIGDDRLREALVDQLDRVDRSYGRDLSVRVVAPDDPDSAVGDPAVLGLVAVLLGWGLVVVVSLLRGPYAATPRRGLARVAVVVAGGLAAGVVAGLVGGGAVAGLVVALAVVGGGLTTLAAEALVGLTGVVVAAVLLVAPAAAVSLAGDTLLLPGPARLVLDGTVPGALAETLRAGASAWPSGWPLVALVSWAALPALVLLAARAVVREGEAAPPRRWRTSTALALVAVVALAGVARAETSRGPVTPRSPADLATDSSCVDTGTVDDVTDLNRVARLRGDAEFQGGDVGVETRLQDGRLLWLFGDTLRSRDGREGFVRNSVLVVEPGCLRVLRAAGGGAVLPDRGDGVGYWPMSVTTQQRPGYDVITVLAQRVRTSGSGVFDFEALGPSVAVLVVPAGRTPQLLTLRDVGADDPDTERPMWGAASVVDGGWLYLYGTARPGDGSSFGFSLSVARVRPDRVLEPRSWTYWDGRRWSARAADAATLVDPVGGVSQTLSVFRRGETWYAFSKRDEFLGEDLVFWTAPAPTGPFTAQPPTGDLPSDLAGGQLRYMPLAHPDLFTSPGSVIVSYSRNSTDLGAVVDDPLLYRPAFLRVRLPTPRRTVRRAPTSRPARSARSSRRPR